MEYLNLASDKLSVSRIGLGLMRIGSKTVEEIEALILQALDSGINLFDHADIYGRGSCEEKFGEVLRRNPSLREKMIIQTKCGIRPKFYDSSKEHIISSVENSLKRLGINYIDILLIHRPDALMEVSEIAEAFQNLYELGKVRYFGVSNMNSMQIELIQSNISFPILFNQIQFSVVHSHLIDSGVNVNMNNHLSMERGGSIIEYSMLNNITLQAWSILQASWEEGTFLNNCKYENLNKCLNELAKKYDLTPAGVAVAWILRHPSKMIAISGTTNPNHLLELTKAMNVKLTRPEWYELYLSVGKMLP